MTQERKDISPKPVFVLGPPGVGHSLLATSLTAGNEFWCSGELHLLYGLVGPDENGESKIYEVFTQASVNESFWLPKNDVRYPEFAEALGLGLNQLITSRAAGLRWVDASPENTWVAAEIALLFPQAKFISLIRNGREMVSEILSGSGSEPSDEEFRSACELWATYAERALGFRRSAHPNWIEVRYEDIGVSASSISRRIIGFLGAKRHRPVADFLSENKEFFSKHERVAWRDEQENLFSKIAGQSMKGLGYDNFD